MKTRISKYIFFFQVFAALLLPLLFFTPGAAEELPVAVVSQEIKPFIEMIEGFEQSLQQPVVRIFLDKKSTPFSHDSLYKGTKIENYGAVVAVGPSALAYLVGNSGLGQEGPYLSDGGKLLYAMVLNPDTLIPENVSLCGISLNLFSRIQVAKISQVFPFVKKVGVLFDPDNNSKGFRAANIIGLFRGISIVPVHIRKQSDVNLIFKDEFSDLDALLFIPDKTVTSPTIIRHIIKQSIARKIPVIGYNRFFNKSGAALSFVLDYSAIGEQMAHKVKGVLTGEPCEATIPSYYMELNKEVVTLLNLEVGTDLPSELRGEQ